MDADQLAMSIWIDEIISGKRGATDAEKALLRKAVAQIDEDAARVQAGQDAIATAKAEGRI